MTHRRPWFDAAYVLLGTEGYAGLKLATLCRALEVTSGGFYHWFESWASFKEALLADWVERRTRALGELAGSAADPVARLELLAASTDRIDHRTEVAMRVWAHEDETVATAVATMDDHRFAVVLDAMQALVGDDDARRFAVLGYSVLVGFEQLAERFEPTELRWSLDRVLESARARSGR